MNLRFLSLALFPLAILLSGCDGKQQSQSPQPGDPLPPVSIPVAFPTPDTLRPDAPIHPQANIYLSGIQIEATVEETREDGSLVLRWIDSTEVEIEKEKYHLANGVFALVAGPSESFSPGIPLLKFPFQIGDTYEWSGTQSVGRNQYPATATVTTSPDTLNTAIGQFETVRVTVQLNVQTGSPGGSDATFQFWFHPDHGMVKREFGISSTREPRAETATSRNGPVEISI